MKFSKVLLNVAACVSTWLVVSRLLGRSGFGASDAASIVAVALGGCVGLLWAERRKARAAA